MKIQKERRKNIKNLDCLILTPYFRVRKYDLSEKRKGGKQWVKEINVQSVERFLLSRTANRVPKKKAKPLEPQKPNKELFYLSGGILQHPVAQHRS
jgi:hypothetical protein